MVERVASTLVLLLLLMGACARGFIPGTSIRDSDQNRAIFDVLVDLRHAFEQRDPNRLLELVSTTYFEDNGTATPNDDYGYMELKDRLIKDCLDTAKEVYVSFELHEIVVRKNYAYADIRYSSRTRLELPAGRLWDTHGDFDRIELAKEDGHWHITSGL